MRSADAGGLALLPVAQVAGGLTFGVGMALAGGCITGMLWKAGGGAVALAIAIAGFAAGELLIRGPGESLIADLDAASRPSERALTGLLGVDYEPLALVVGVAALVLLLRRRRDGLIPGVALGLVAAAAWIAADAAGYGYGLGFVGAAEGTRRALDAGGELPFQLWLALGVVAGGAVAGRPRLRMPDGAPGRARARRAACSWASAEASPTGATSATASPACRCSPSAPCSRSRAWRWRGAVAVHALRAQPLRRCALRRACARGCRTPCPSRPRASARPPRPTGRCG